MAAPHNTYGQPPGMCTSMKLLCASVSVLALLAGCNATNPYGPSGPMASGRDRTFSVPVYGPDTSQAYAAASRECQRMALHAKLLRNDGSRLVFDRDGYLFVTLGENNDRPTAQDLDKLQGKVVRIYPDGRVPDDNPFVGQPGARPEIWSYGQRNPQGAALNPWTGTLWENEHGPRGGDEINIIERGKNYGWPLATHGINYSLLPIPEARGKTAEGTVGPHHVWEKSPAISGMAFYDADRFKAWQHNLFIGALASQELIRLQFEGDKVVHEERLLGELKAGIRDVRQGPDGFLYVLTDEED
eukprot:gene2614-3391_t